MTAISSEYGNGRQARTLIFSQRNLSSIQPFRCAHFEFEDVIAEIDDVDFVSPQFDPNTRRQHFTKQLAYHTPLQWNPGIKNLRSTSNTICFLQFVETPLTFFAFRAPSIGERAAKKLYVSSTRCGRRTSRTIEIFCEYSHSSIE